MISSADMLSGLRRFLKDAQFQSSPELERLLQDLETQAGPGTPEQWQQSLKDALPELLKLRAQIPELLVQDLPPQSPARDAQSAAEKLKLLTSAWERQDGAAVDALLKGLGESPRSERTRIEADVRASISASFANFRMKALGDP